MVLLSNVQLKNIDMARDRRPIRTMRPAIPSSHHKIQKRSMQICLKTTDCGFFFHFPVIAIGSHADG